ncbi:condensation domain-containing protein, partial [Streptomyces ardesiacus]
PAGAGAGPAGEPDGAPATVRYAQAAVVLDERETTALRAAGRDHGLTLTTLVQGAWAFLLSRYTTSEDVVLGVTTPGRPAELPGAQDLVGLLVNTLPLRVRMPSEAPWAEWMRELQETYARVREHEYHPLVRIQQCGGIGSGESLFETVVLVEDWADTGDGTDAEDGTGAGDGTGAEDGAATEPGPALRMNRVHEESHAPYPLSLVATPGRRLALTLHYDTRRLAAATAERAAGHLRRVLTDLTARPHARTGELALLTPAEFDRLVHEWNDTDTPYSRDLCIHDLFERQARRTPDALALLFQDERWTYREVDERANQIAHLLTRLGVTRGDHVAILLERRA